MLKSSERHRVSKHATDRNHDDDFEDEDDVDYEDAFELECDLRLEQHVTGAPLHLRQQKRTTLCFVPGEGLLVAKIQGTDVHIRMRGPKAKVSVHCSLMAEGKISFRDLSRNLSVMVSNAMPCRLREFQQGIKRSLGAPKTPPKWQPPSPTSPWSRAQKRRVALSPSSYNKRNKIDPIRRAPGAKGAEEQVLRLSAQQEAVVEMALSGSSFFLTGGAGTGKSVVLREIIRRLPPDTTFVTAPTGIAALNIGGLTIHEFAGIGGGNKPAQEIATRVARQSAGARWKRAETLIIDEVSMLSGQLFDLLDSLARLLRPSHKDAPFGGIQVIACGDFFQLPPVRGRDEPEVALCFEAHAWAQAMPLALQLDQVFRQQDDKCFLEMLQHIRWGRCPADVTSMLKDCMQRTRASQCAALSVSSPSSSSSRRFTTRLMTHRADVDRFNSTQLDKLAGSVVVCSARDEGDERALAVLQRSCNVPKVLHLKLQAQVMLTKTVNRSLGLVNGSRGEVVGFSSSGLPHVLFETGETCLITAEPSTVSLGFACTASRTQVPLQLAWAISIHKAQGLSLKHVDVSLAKVFEPGQAYVALSRACSLSGLGIIDFAPSAVRADPKVVSFYRALAAAPGANDEAAQVPPDGNEQHDAYPPPPPPDDSPR